MEKVGHSRLVRRANLDRNLGSPLTHACRLKMSREENGSEAKKCRQASSVLPIPSAVLVEDVDLEWLKPEAGIDPYHTAGPYGEEEKFEDILSQPRKLKI